RLRVPRVVSVDRRDSPLRVVNRGKCKEPLTDGQDVSEPGVLCHHRPSGRQIAGAPFAEPAAPQPNVLILRYRKLSARANDVVTVPVQVAREAHRVAHSPPMALEKLSINRLVAAQRQLEQ